MATVIITFKIMPESPDVNLANVEKKATHLIKEFGGEVGKVEMEPIAFGLKALKLMFVMNEALGGTDNLEAEIGKIEGVNSVEVADCRRAIG